MRKTNLRGGADYKINEILGKNFKDFVGLLRGNDLSKFTFEAYGDKSASTTGGSNSPKPNDLHYDFSQFLMAAAAAFREVEKPDTEKAKVSGEYVNELKTMYDELVGLESGRPTGGISSPEMYTFEYKALPYCKKQGMKINYLGTVLHFLPYTDKIFDTYDDSSYTGLANAIRYIYHFLSILDLDNINVRDVMVLLRTDNAGFMDYVNQIVDALTSSIYFSKESKLPSDSASKAVIRDSVLNGLTAVAEEIINELRNIPVNLALPVKYDEINQVNFSTEQSIKDYYAKLGITGKMTALNSAANALVADRNVVDALYDRHKKVYGVDFSTESVRARAAVPDPNRRKEYAFDSYMNPYYLSNIFKPVINANEISGPLAQVGGSFKITAKAKAVPVLGSYISLPFLYGPASPPAAAPGTETRQLTTNGKQGTENVDAELAESTVIAHLTHYIDTVTAFGGPINNPARIVLLSIITYIIEQRRAVLASEPNLSEHIKKNLLAYNKFITRIRRTPDIETLLKRYRDSFVTEFTNRSSKDYTFDPATKQLVPRQPGTSTAGKFMDLKTSNLTDPVIARFYTDVVAADPKFYGEFFNLVRLGDVGTFKGYSGDVPLAEAKGLPQSDLSKYRLNVRKNEGYTRLHNLQTGGAGESNYGEIVFISLIPDYPTDGSIGEIWLTKTYKVPKSEITSRGTDVVRSIPRIVYISQAAGTATLDVLGENIDIVDLARRVGTTGYFLKHYPDFLKKYLRGIASASPLSSSSTWKEGELMISEHMLRDGNTWQRQGDHFVKLDKNGKEIDNIPVEDNCTYIGDTRGCLDFLTECLPAENEADYNTFCDKLLKFDFKTNMGMKVVSDEVQKIDPQVAFAILRKLRFGSFLEEEKINPPVKGFRRYKVQSVGSWLEELMSGVDRCKKYTVSANADFNCGPLRDQLGALTETIIKMAQDPKQHNFFNYLDILVHWVNANPQVLNPEETQGSIGVKQLYPRICNSYKTYDYVDPYKPAEIRLRGMSCGLDRLKSSIMNELSGANASATISTIASVPLGIEMPLSRYAFTNAVPFGGITPMVGGLYEIESELNKWNQAYGYELFDSIFRDLYSTMGNLVGKRGMRLSNTTNKNIEDKLGRFKETEEALRQSLKNLIEKNKLFQASRGQIDAFDLNDAQLAAVLEKHSNLLALGSAYNKKAVNLIDLFQTITNAILNKLNEGTTAAKSESQNSQSKYQRPLTMDFHYNQKGANKKN